MSKIVAMFESTEFTFEQYDALWAEMKAQGYFYDPVRPLHLCFNNDGKFTVIDVWNSEADLMDFAQNRLFPLFQKLGIEPVAPKILPVYNWIGEEKAG